MSRPDVVISSAVSPDAPTLLQLLPPNEEGKIRIPDLNEAPLYVLERNNNKKDNLQVYVRRSPRIQKAYDGEHVTSVERASRRLAAATPTSFGGSTSSSGSRGRAAVEAALKQRGLRM